MSVLKPRSHSSLATQPPLMPEPTTIASKIMSSSLSGRGSAADFRQRQAGAPRAGNEFVAQLDGRAHFGVVVAHQHQELHAPVVHVDRGDELFVDGLHERESILRTEREKAR